MKHFLPLTLIGLGGIGGYFAADGVDATPPLFFGLIIFGALAGANIVALSLIGQILLNQKVSTVFPDEGGK